MTIDSYQDQKHQPAKFTKFELLRVKMQLLVNYLFYFSKKSILIKIVIKTILFYKPWENKIMFPPTYPYFCVASATNFSLLLVKKLMIHCNMLGSNLKS